MNLLRVQLHRSRILLLTAGIMVVMLFLCPAVNRVVRVQRIDQSIGYSPSFQRSLHVPPRRAVAPPDTQAAVLVVIASAEVTVAHFPQPADDLLPPLIPPTSPRSLRAPPAAL